MSSPSPSPVAPPRIALLSPLVIDQIAAGEVVERPASVVKELVDNAIDAGATRVDVELEEGGLALIAVRDNGRGIHPEDLLLAVTRHATSKLRDPSELTDIGTLGFRGEALASIAAVARLDMRSRQPSAAVGHHLHVRPGEPPRLTPAGLPLGTQVEVRGLFNNLPARRKFMRAEATEVGQCSEILLRLAVVHPEVHVTLRHGKRELLNLPRGTLEQRVAQVLGRRVNGALFGYAGEEDGTQVQVWLPAPEAAGRGRGGPYLVVRRRVVRERSLAQIVAQAYGLSGEATACLFVEQPRASVDVNVHPQKSEIRFSDPQRVYAAVRRVLAAAMSAAPWAGAAVGSVEEVAGRGPEVVAPRPSEAPQGIAVMASPRGAEVSEEPRRGSRSRAGSGPVGAARQVSSGTEEVEDEGPGRSRGAGGEGSGSGGAEREVSSGTGGSAAAGRRDGPVEDARRRGWSGERWGAPKVEPARPAETRDDGFFEAETASFELAGRRGVAGAEAAEPGGAAASSELASGTGGAGTLPELASGTGEARGGGYRLSTRALAPGYDVHKRGVMAEAAALRPASDPPPTPQDEQLRIVTPNLRAQELAALDRAHAQAAARGYEPSPADLDEAPALFAAEVLAPAVPEDRSVGPAVERGAGPVRAEVPQLLTCLPGPVALFVERDTLLAVDLRRLRSHLVYLRLQRDLIGRRVVAVQGLLAPAVVRRPAEEVALIVAARAELLTLGVDLDDFGGDAVVVRGVPAHLRHCVDDADVADLIARIVPWLRIRTREADASAVERGLLGAIAATRGGDPAPRLARRWLSELLEAGATLAEVPGLRRWSAAALLGEGATQPPRRAGAVNRDDGAAV